MAEPKKETVRIALPPRPEPAGSSASDGKRDTARIVLPSRTPVMPIRRSPPNIAALPSAGPAPEAPVLPRRPPVITPATSPMLQPLPKPPGVEKESDSANIIRPVPPAREENAATPLVNRGPKNETARINILPRPVPAAPPAINMTKTQPLLVQPAATAPIAPVVITSRPIVPLETIPRPLCWALAGISTVIFLIQIWNYVVS